MFCYSWAWLTTSVFIPVSICSTVDRSIIAEAGGDDHSNFEALVAALKTQLDAGIVPDVTVLGLKNAPKDANAFRNSLDYFAGESRKGVGPGRLVYQLEAELIRHYCIFDGFGRKRLHVKLPKVVRLAAS